jgi:thioredoxin-related protein
MKKILLFVAAAVLLSPNVFAGGKNKGGKKPAEAAAAATAVTGDSEIKWMSLEQVEAAMKTKPKKVWIDVYTDWCGWCKVMDKKTFSNVYVAQYMNEHFYSVRLNAEQTDSIAFMGQKYGLVPGTKTNRLVVEMLGERLSYPTGVFMEENFQGAMPIPGYQDVANMEMILKYLAQGLNKTTPWPVYQKNFKASWL